MGFADLVSMHVMQEFAKFREVCKGACQVARRLRLSVSGLCFFCTSLCTVQEDYCAEECVIKHKMRPIQNFSILIWFCMEFIKTQLKLQSFCL